MGQLLYKLYEKTSIKEHINDHYPLINKGKNSTLDLKGIFTLYYKGL
jgi:hypothetical protein